MRHILAILILLVGCNLGTATYDGPGEGEDGGGGGAAGGTSVPTGPQPPPPTDPDVSGAGLSEERWLRGSEEINHFEFSWVNPTENFDHAEVSMGINFDDDTTDFTPYERSNNASSHIFSDVQLVECDRSYFPIVKAISPGGVSSEPAVIFDGLRYDNTLPLPVTSIDTSANDGLVIDTIDKAVTADWSAGPGSDNCEITYYEMAIGYDANLDGFKPDETQNVLPFTKIPGGGEVKRYQALSGKDGFVFELQEGVNYYTTIRIVDKVEYQAESAPSSAWSVSSTINLPPVDFPPPTNLQLSSSWVNGNNPSSPIFSWTNPTDPEFDHAKVNLGVYDGITGDTTYVGEEHLGIGIDSYVWSGLTLKECVDVFYPIVMSVSKQGFSSPPQIYFDGFQYDNTPSDPVTNIDASAKDSSLTDDMDDITRAPTTTWTPGADNCSGIHYFEIAIGTSTGDRESVLSFTRVPGLDATTSFQVVDGFIYTDEDGATQTFNFKTTLDDGVDYFTSIRAVDNAGNTSGHETSDAWEGVIFSPDDLAGLFAWIDASDAETLFRDDTCMTTPSIPSSGGYNPRCTRPNEPDIIVTCDPENFPEEDSRVKCFKDKSGNNNDFIRVYWDWEPWPETDDTKYRLPVYRSNGLNNSLPALHFFGTTLDATPSGTPTGVGGRPLSLKYENHDQQSRSIIMVGDFSKVVDGNKFENGHIYRGKRSLFRTINDYFRVEMYSQGVIEATEDGLEGQFVSIIGEADQSSPTETTSKRELYIEGRINSNYIETVKGGGFDSYEGFILGSQNQGGQLSVKDLFISEVLHYDRNLSMEERQKVEGYVACKWNLRSKLPSYHPYSPDAAVDLGCPFRKN